MKGMGFNAAAQEKNGSGAAASGKKRKRSAEREDEDDEGGGTTKVKKPKAKKTKISSGLSVIVTHRGSKSGTSAPSRSVSKANTGEKGNDAWWSSLPTSKAGLKVP